MIVLLPPSETKARGPLTSGGHAAATSDFAPTQSATLDLGALSFPELTPVRERIATTVTTAAQNDPDGFRAALKLSATLANEVQLDAELFDSPAGPAIRRYTGVLYDALSYDTLSEEAQKRADRRLVIGSALFGAVRADDRIPAYRLSAGSRVPSLGTMRKEWSPLLGDVLSTLATPGSTFSHSPGSANAPEDQDQDQDGIVVDLRSGAYAQLGRVPEAVTVAVVTEYPDGSRKVVSHFAKHFKGLLARVLVETGSIDDASAPSGSLSAAEAVAAVCRAAGYRLEVDGPTALTMVTTESAPPARR